MNILIFSPYYPPHIGGVEFYAEEMNTQLMRFHNLTIFTPQLPKNSLQNEFLFNKNIKIIRFPAFEIVSNYPLPKFWTITFWKLFTSLFHQRFDIMISHTRFFNTSFLALIYAKIKKTPWMHIEHGSDFVQSSGHIIKSIARAYDYTIGKLILQTSSINIAISNNVALFIKKFNKRPSPVIQRGINISEIDAIKKNTSWKEKYPNKLIIGFVGRLIDGKGLLDLIKVFGKISDQSFICLIIGDGPQKTILQNAINKYDLQNKVFLLGRKTHHQTIALMKSFDIFVNPSYTEGLPTTVLESSICKNAIIATDVGGTNEIIKHAKTGYLFLPKDIVTLQKYLIDLIENPAKIRRLGKIAKQLTAQKFSWQKSIKRYEKEFEKLINE